MEKQTPSLRQRIIEAWLDEMGTYQELAEFFEVSQAYIKHVLRPFRRPERARRLNPIRPDTLATSREIYSVLPMEVADPFTYRFEELTGLNVGMLMTPVA
jgi:hypothetical protein